MEKEKEKEDIVIEMGRKMNEDRDEDRDYSELQV